MDIAQLIQKQVSLGSLVVFTLKTGQEITGTLIEMSRNHVSLEQSDGIATLLIETIGSWKVISGNTLEDDIPTITVSTQDEQDEEMPSSVINNDTTDEVLQSLKETQIRFEARLDALQILEPISPDFAIEDEELSIWKKSDTLSIWHSAKSKYEYAVKVNELSALLTS